MLRRNELSAGETNASEHRLRRELVAGLGGDAAAYHAFLASLGSRLRAYFRRRMTRWPDEVEDLVQETLIAVHNQRHTYDADQPLTAWVHAIAKYKLIDLMRRSGRRDALTEPLHEEAAELASQADGDAAQARRDLGKLLELLPDHQRLPILHVKVQGLSVIEAAALTGMSVSAVKVGVHRGLKALAKRIRSEG
jgi:RNA polymerase sigma-70 factor, ECF subfamily